MKKGFAVLGILAALAAAAFGACYFDETPPPLDEMIVGLWQNNPSVGSGIGECYRFYADGTYLFEPSEFVFDLEDYRPPRSAGAWEAHGDSITLHMTQKTVVEGGQWVEDPFIGFALEGGIEKTIAASKEIYTIYLGVFKDLDRDMLSIGGRTYWKISGDPNDYLD